MCVVRCSQCNRPAFENLQGHPLCVEHAEMVKRSRLEEMHILERLMYEAEMNVAEVTGVPGMVEQVLAKRAAMAPKSTSINIAHSNVGAVNTGTINSLNVKMTRLHDAGNAEIAQAILGLTMAITVSGLPVAKQNELRSQLDFVAEQAGAAPEQRKPAVVKLALGNALQTALSTTADLLQLWNQWGPACS